MVSGHKKKHDIQNMAQIIIIVIGHYKWEDCEIDADRLVDIRLTDSNSKPSHRNTFQ